METVGIGYDEIISFRIGEKRFRIGGPYEISSWMMDARWCEGADIGYACLARLTRSAGSITRNQVYVSWYAYFQTVTYDLDEMQPSSLPLASLPFPSRVPPCVSRLQLAPSYLINVFLSFSPHFPTVLLHLNPFPRVVTHIFTQEGRILLISNRNDSIFPKQMTSTSVLSVKWTRSRKFCKERIKGRVNYVSIFYIV